MQDGKFVPGVVVTFWYQLVFHIATTGLLEYFFESSKRSDCEVSGNRRESLKPKTTTKIRTTNRQWETACEISRSGYRSSEDTEVPATAHISHDPDAEQPAKVASRMHNFFSLPERSILRSMLANQDDKGSLQRTHWRSSIDNSRSQGPQ